MATGDTVLTIPSGVTVLTDRGFGPPEGLPPFAASSTTLSGGFALYVPVEILSPTSVVNIHALVTALGTDSSIRSGLSAWYGDATTPITSVPTAGNFVSVTGPNTIWVPYAASLPAQVPVGAYTDLLNAALSNATRPATTSASVMPQSSANNQTQSTMTPSEAGLPSSTTSRTSSSTPATTDGNFSTGSLVGGILGGFVGGLLLASLLACFLLRRRKRTNRRPSPAASKQSGSDTRSNDEVSYNDGRFSKGVVVASWEKHLPQEKDDKTIVQAVKSVFEQAQIHVEGYYKASSGKPPAATIKALESISGDELPELLLQNRSSLPVFEGILIRWIVHRISLRSATEDSLLPEIFSKIAKENKWDMEVSGGAVSESKGTKQGFSEAFSRWRVLTGFLYSGINKDPEFRNGLETKIQRASRSLADALGPWSSSKDDATRTESLRDILHQASDLGILLFTQPSTFLFDWPATSEGSIAVRPALVERQAGGDEKRRTFIEAKMARV